MPPPRGTTPTTEVDTIELKYACGSKIFINNGANATVSVIRVICSHIFFVVLFIFFAANIIQNIELSNRKFLSWDRLFLYLIGRFGMYLGIMEYYICIFEYFRALNLVYSKLIHNFGLVYTYDLCYTITNHTLLQQS